MINLQLGIIEDEPLVLGNLEFFLNKQAEFEVIVSDNSVEGFLGKIHGNSKIDLVLLDIGLPGISGLEGIRPIKERLPNTDILILSAYDDSDKIFKALCAGAVSYLSKRSDLHTIKDALLTVNRGGFIHVT